MNKEINKIMMSIDILEVKDKHKIIGKRFCKLIQEGIISKTILPNHALDFSIELRKYDLEKYKNFIMSSSYDDIMDQKEVIYVGE